MSLPQISKLLTKEDLIESINEVMREGMASGKELFSKDSRDIENRRWLQKNFPDEVRRRDSWFFRYLGLAIPSRVMHQTVDPPGRKITAEDIEGLGLSKEQLKKLAGIKDAE